MKSIKFTELRLTVQESDVTSCIEDTK